MCLCASLAALLLAVFPSLQPILRIVGAVYIAWLAVYTFLSSMRTGPTKSALLGFSSGLLLQLFNAKVVIYGLTLYSTFLGALFKMPAILGLSAAAFAIIGFAATSLWAVPVQPTSAQDFIHGPVGSSPLLSGRIVGSPHDPIPSLKGPDPSK